MPTAPGKKRNDKPRPIIIRLYSRPFNRCRYKQQRVQMERVRIVEDFTPRKKALPLMKQAYDESKKVCFTRGKLFIDGREIYVA